MDSLLDTFDESSEVLRAQYDRLSRLGTDETHAKAKFDALCAFHDAFVAHVDATSRGFDATRTPAEREADDLHARDIQSGDTNTKPLLDALTPPSANAMGAFSAYWTHAADLWAQLSACSALGLGAAREASLTESSLAALREKAARVGTDGRVCAVLREKANRDVAVRRPPLVQQTASGGAAEGAAQRRRLVAWCRQQRANLDALSDPDHIQEYAAALLEHYKLMSRNFALLCATAEPMADDVAVQDGLMEANEAWMQLQVCALEQLRQTLFEVHSHTSLEEHVEQQSLYAKHAFDVLEEIVKHTPSSIASSGTEVSPELMERMQQLVRDAAALKAANGGHESLQQGFEDFAERMRTLREAYNCFRAAALSRVACLSTSEEILEAATRRRGEYDACIDELQAWADERARCDAWREVRDRVHDAQKLLDEAQAHTTTRAS